MTNLTELRKKAEAATPGPWVYVPDNAYDDWELYNPETVVWVKQDDSGVPISKDDGEYLAAANPVVVLALLDRVEAYRDALERLMTSEVILNAPFASYSEAIANAREALARFEEK